MFSSHDFSVSKSAGNQSGAVTERKKKPLCARADSRESGMKPSAIKTDISQGSGSVVTGMGYVYYVLLLEVRVFYFVGVLRSPRAERERNCSLICLLYILLPSPPVYGPYKYQEAQF